MTYYCSSCLAAVSLGDTTCPLCSASLSSDRPYVEKVVTALHHPDPFIQLRMAWILGRLKDERAVEPLTEVLRSRDQADPYARAEAAAALGAIGGSTAQRVLCAVVDDESESIIVRRAARQALAQGQSGELQARCAGANI